MGRFKFQLVDNLGNFVNEQYTSKRQVLKLVGEHIANTDIRKDAVTCLEKEKEGVFDFDAEMAQIEKAMQQVHGPTVEQAQQ